MTIGGMFPEGRGKCSRNGCLLPSQVQRVEFQGREQRAFLFWRVALSYHRVLAQ